jgi:hypothetical protein
MDSVGASRSGDEGTQSRPHSVAVLVVGVLRGLRSSSLRTNIQAFLDTLGPPDVVDVLGLFELLAIGNHTAEDFGTATVGSTDRPCTHAESESLFANTFAAGGLRYARMRFESTEEVAEAKHLSWTPGVNAYAFAQFHKIRLAFGMLVKREQELGSRFDAVLRLRTDQTFHGTFLDSNTSWLRPASLMENTVYMYHDAFWVAQRDAFGQVSRIWDHGVRMGIHLKARHFTPLDWTRLEKSTWAMQDPGRKPCSNFLLALDMPVGLFGMSHNHARITVPEVRKRIRNHVRHSTLGDATSGLDLSRTFVLAGWLANASGSASTRKRKTGNEMDFRKVVDPEVFLGSTVLHPSQPVGPLVLQCAVHLLRAQTRGVVLSSLPHFGFLHGRHTMRC